MHSRILTRGLKSFGIKGRKQELCDGVNDVAGVIEDAEEMVERIANVPETYRSTASAYAASHHTKGRSTIFSASVAVS